MSLWKRLKTLWKLSSLEYPIILSKMVEEFKDEPTQFIDPVSFKEKFEQSNKIDDLLE